MEIKEIDRVCDFCSDEAKVAIKKRDREMCFCKDCAIELYWNLTHSDYMFD